MSAPDDFPATPKKSGSHAEMIERQKLRDAGILNAPLRGTRGLAIVAGQMRQAGFSPRQDLLRLRESFDG